MVSVSVFGEALNLAALWQLPLIFLSSATMQASLLPHWMRTIAKFNPVNWAVVAARAAAMQKTDNISRSWPLRCSGFRRLRRSRDRREPERQP